MDEEACKLQRRVLYRCESNYKWKAEYLPDEVELEEAGVKE